MRRPGIRKVGVLAGFVLVALAAAPASAGALSFSKTDYGTGTNSNPSDVAIAFLGSGNQDLAVTLQGANTLVTLLGSGTGAFTGPFACAPTGCDQPTQAGPPTDSLPLAVAIADFNGDNKQDLAIGNFFGLPCNPGPCTNNTRIYFGSGDGTKFTFNQSLNGGTSVSDIAVGDFNGDSKPDLALANQAADTASVLLNNGSGTFGAATSYNVGDNPRGIAAGDFNEDGSPDLAVANQADDTVSVLMNKDDNSGTFNSATTTAGGDGNAGIVVGSFNADVNTDLATANTVGGNVSVLLGNGSGGFSAAPGSPYPAGAGAVSIAKDIFDGDANQDLAVANQGAGTVSVLLGSASGAFTTASGSPFSVGGGPVSLQTGSFNGDGLKDIVTANSTGNNVSVLLQQTTPTITTSATLNATVGSSISDTATLAGGSSPTGTITFNAYGPSDASCANAPAYPSNAITVSGNGMYSNAPTFTPATAGTYRWRAFYSGDSNNAAVSTPCLDSNETSTVAQAQPTMTTQATDTTAGGTITDTATLAAGQSPTGTITFTVWGPGDMSCSGTAVGQRISTVSGNGNYTTTPAFDPTGIGYGSFRWRAVYSGDANNNAVSTPCNDNNETSTVSQATPTIATSASASVTVGSSISDQATLSGGSSPTGTVTFTAYGPDDSTCANAPAHASSPVALSGGTAMDSFTPVAAGTYRWRASYSGDANNVAVSGACNDANESSAVNPVIPTPPVIPPTQPSNAFSVTVTGSTLRASVTSAGRVDVVDARAPLAATSAKKKKKKRQLRPSSATGNPPAITVPLLLTNAAKKALKQNGKLRVRARITFAPSGGTANIQTVGLTIKRKKQRS